VASVQIYRIQFLANNPFGSFMTGDVLDIFMDTDLAVVPSAPFDNQGAGISVLLNSVDYPLAGAGFILDFSPSIMAIQEFSPQICSGTSLLVFGLAGFWPYTTYYSQENHYSCQINSPTCNLMVVGVPIVTPATDSVTADGAIHVYATSSNDIQYKLNADFAYDDGTASLESYFSGLLPGSYRVYLRDSANCGVNVLVDLNFSNVYGPKYRLEYYDNDSCLTKIDVLQRGYSGSITEVCGSGTPFQILLRGEGSQNKFEPLMSSQGNLSLVSETDSQFLELYTNDPNLFRIEYSKDFNNMTDEEFGFTPAPLANLSAWTNIDTGGPAWNISLTPYIDFNLLGLNITSDLLRTDYAFEEGREYTFYYEFFCENAFGTFKVKILDSSNVELLNTDIIISQVTQAGYYIVTAPSGAAKIGIQIFSAASCGSPSTFCQKRINYFSNVTATIPSTPPVAIGYEILWKGKILPQQYSEEYKFPPYYVSVVATDGLAELQNYYLIQPDGSKYFGTISLIKLVAHCLKFIKLDLNIRVGCNLYAENMLQEDANDPFEQAYVDFDAFYLAEAEPTLDFVLKSILEAFGCRITQWEDKWNIVRVEEMLAEYDRREFDKDGNYLLNDHFNPVIDVLYPNDAVGDLELDAELDAELGTSVGVILANADHNLELKPGYGKIKGIYRLGLKPNILSNGDFRLKSFYNPFSNTYFYDINRDGWTLVNAGYVLTEGYEFIDKTNVAYTISSATDTLTGEWGGEAYLQSETYFVKMGANNQLKILVRCKVSRVSAYFGLLTYTIDVPYVKIRIRVKYGDLSLQSNGAWAEGDSILVFYCTEFNKYVDYEILAQQPTTSSPVGGMDLDVRVYHGYAYHADFFELADLRAFQTYNGVDPTIPTGYRTELRDADAGGFFGDMFYYEFEKSVATDDGVFVVEPDDYDAVFNPKKWILKTTKAASGTLSQVNVFPFAIDRVVISYLTEGDDPIDTIVRTINGESGNPIVLEKKVILGSHSDLIVTEPSFSFDLGIFFPPGGGLAIHTTNILSSDLIYTGYLRSATGEGYEYFTRDGVAESDKLHGILLKQYASQYKKSWRLFRGSMYAIRYFGLLNSMRNPHDANRVYLPMGLSYDEKMRTWNGEFVEIGASTAGSVGEVGTPFSSGFTIGYGPNGFD